MSAAEIGELIHQAGFGLVSWDAVNAAIVDHIPGSFSGINSQNRDTGACNFFSVAGIPTQSMREYGEYYATVNPWNPHWERWRTGEIMRSTTHCPVQQFPKNEFINDWLQPLQKNSIALGVKLDATAQDNVRMFVHIPGRLAEHEVAGIAMMKEQCGNLIRATEMNRFLSDHIGKSVAAAALVERGASIGFVVDYNFRIVEANTAAVNSFSTGAPVKASGKSARFEDETQQKWFAHNVRRLIARSADAEHTHILPENDHVWQIKLARVHEHDPRHGNRFFAARQLVLVLVKDVRTEHLLDADFSVLKAFALTPSEIRMCRVLVAGCTINEAADDLGITIETARHRLKTIFQKTGTHRQTALISLLLKSL